MGHRYSDIIILLASGISQRRMYFDNHPKVQAISRQFVAELQPAIRETELSELAVGIFAGKFVREGKYLVGPSIAGRTLIEFAEHLCCGGFVFRLPLSPDDMVRFFRLAVETTQATDSLEAARQLLESVGLSNIELTEPLSEVGENEESDGSHDEDVAPEAGSELDFMASDFAPLLRVYQAMYETVANNNLALSGENRIDLTRARAQGEELVAVSDRGALDVMQFMRYPDFDSYTIGHSVRVAALGVLLARELGWPSDVRNEVATAGLLHDLGKGKVPEEILFKPGALNDDERTIMETHPALGARILLANGETSPIVLSATWGHHLRKDGRGYPAMPSWFSHSSAASLIHVCDVFEALTAARPYKNPLCPRRAFEIMISDKNSFQPLMLSALVRVMGLYPPGSEVRLSDQRLAVVVSKGVEPEKPLVRVTHGSRGEPIARADQPAIELSEVEGVTIEEFLKVGTDGTDENEPILHGASDEPTLESTVSAIIR